MKHLKVEFTEFHSLEPRYYQFIKSIKVSTATKGLEEIEKEKSKGSTWKTAIVMEVLK